MRTKMCWVLLISLTICQCGSFLGKKVETRTVWESGGEYIRLFREVGGNRGYNQPAHFHEDDLRRVLLSLYYAKYQFFRWSTSSRVFEEAEAGKLAPFFQRAFLEAGPDDVVEFYLPRRADKLFGVSDQIFLTRGRAFVEGGKLHFRFDNVRQPLQTYAVHSDNQEPLPPAGWKLVPQEGQAYGMQAASIGPESENVHWLAIDLSRASAPHAASEGATLPVVVFPANAPGSDRPSAGREQAVPQAGTAPARASAPNAEAREKLHELKQMLKEDLITQEDYDRKKKEILDGY